MMVARHATRLVFISGSDAGSGPQEEEKE